MPVTLELRLGQIHVDPSGLLSVSLAKPGSPGLVRDSAKINKVENNRGRCLMLTSGFHMCLQQKVCLCASMCVCAKIKDNLTSQFLVT